jgi:hypothetical protein
MHISRFIGASIAVIVVIMLVVSLGAQPSSFSLSVFGFSFVFPTAIWMALPAVVMMIAAVGHMVYYSALRYYHQRGDDKEIKALGDLFLATKEGREFHYTFKNCTIKEVAQKINPAGVDEQMATTDECESENSGEWGTKAGKAFRQWMK